MRSADCIFTPIHGEIKITSKTKTAEIKTAETKTAERSINNNYYDNYRAAAWNEGPYSYTQRGRCRVEMFYATLPTSL